ncbi:MAG: arginine deiminase-related protein [Saprospiraceae bacterium]
MTKQLTNNILMVRPANFGYNSETGKTNSFQILLQNSTDEIQSSAIKEFDSMVEQLRQAGINVLVIDDLNDVIRPDAIFPNNWVSFHQDGTVITYPMQSLNRRIERREDIIEEIGRHFEVKKRYSLDIFEEHNQFLEGTGSMIFDHDNKLIYACLSARTDAQLLQNLALLLQYKVVFFHAYNETGVPIYHTNVMMALGKDFVVICMDSIIEKERDEIKNIFDETSKEIINISFHQMNSFAGNMLQLIDANNNPVLIMSQSAYSSLTRSQISSLEAKTKIIPIDIRIIETIGGGSVRCMMAEIFLPKK